MSLLRLGHHLSQQTQPQSMPQLMRHFRASEGEMRCWLHHWQQTGHVKAVHACDAHAACQSRRCLDLCYIWV